MLLAGHLKGHLAHPLYIRDGDKRFYRQISFADVGQAAVCGVNEPSFIVRCNNVHLTNAAIMQLATYD